MRKLLAAGASAVLAIAIGCAQSDGGITAKVKPKLAADTTVSVHEINVDTRDRVVTLTGTVDSQAARERALEIARGTQGVTNVVDNLAVRERVASGATIGEAVGQTVDDAAITAKARPSCWPIP